MGTIRLKYKKLGVRDTEETLLLPLNADGCTLEQLRLLAPFWAWGNPGHQTRLKVLAILLKVKIGFLIRFEPEKLHRLCELSDWVFDDPSFSKKILPAIEVNGNKFHGPEECLFNCTFIEFIHADELAGDYAKSMGTDYLDLLIATLYRPTKSKEQLDADSFNGDVRRPYNYYLTKVYAQDIKKLEMPYKTIVLMFWAGCKQHIMRGFPDVFPDKKNGRPNGGPYQLAQKLLAKEGTLGDLEKVQNENLYNAFDMLQDIIIKNRKDD